MASIAVTNAHNAGLTISKAMADMTTEELCRMAMLLDDLKERARECYRDAQRREHDVTTATYEPVEAQPVRTALTRQPYRCESCRVSWYGSELVIAEPIITKTCAYCERKAAARAQVEANRTGGLVSTEYAGGDEPTVEAPFQLAEGIYTVTFGDGQYRTLKIKTQDADASFAAGKTVAYYLNGPDNWRNYKGFAFVNLETSGYSVWQSYRGEGMIVDALRVLLSGKEAMVNGLKAYGQRSGSCGLCGRQLTTPESLALGIGPICAAKLGI